MNIPTTNAHPHIITQFNPHLSYLVFNRAFPNGTIAPCGVGGSYRLFQASSASFTEFSPIQIRVQAQHFPH